MKKYFLTLALLPLILSAKENLKFDVNVDNKKKIVITVSENTDFYTKDELLKILKELNLSEEDFFKLNISIKELKNMDKVKIQKLLTGEINE